MWRNVQGTAVVCTAVSQLRPCRSSESRRFFIEHSTDPKQWRSPQKQEIKRRHRGGVSLGSDFVRLREQAEAEQALIDQDKFTNWNVVNGFALLSAVLLVGLHLLMDFVKPVPSPEYISCEPAQSRALENEKHN